MLRQAGEGSWGGLWRACDAATLAADAARLYSEPRLWTACQQAGFRYLPRLYDAQVLSAWAPLWLHAGSTLCKV